MSELKTEIETQFELSGETNFVTDFGVLQYVKQRNFIYNDPELSRLESELSGMKNRVKNLKTRLKAENKFKIDGYKSQIKFIDASN